MGSTLETLFPTLFPIFIMIATIVIALYYLYLKKVEANAPVKAKEPRSTQPAVTFVGVETGRPSDVVEGFQSSGGGSPRWSGPSTRFGLSINDRYYKEYANNNLTPSPDILALMNSIQVTDKKVTSYGSLLSNFDADINRIPWDADNAQYIQKDVVWGYVSQSASNSIFLKAYHKKLLSDIDNLIEGETTLQYRSPVLQVNATDEATSMALQLFDGMAAAVGQQALEALGARVLRIIEDSAVSAIRNKMERINGKFSVKDIGSLNWIEKKALNDISLSEDRNAARQAKIERPGGTLTNAEKIEQQIYNSAQTDPDKKGKFSGENVKKVVKNVSGADKIAVGAKRMTKLTDSKKGGKMAAKFVQKLGKKMGTKLTAMSIKMVMFRVIGAFLMALNVACTTAAVVTAGILAFLAVISNMLVILWNALDVAATVVVVMLQILLPTLLDRAMKNGSLCKEGKPLDVLIEDEALYFIFTTFCPIGSVLDAFGPYTCYKDDGSIVLKTPLYIPPYFADSSLSTSKHTFPPSQTPRGDSTTFRNSQDSLGPGWKVTAGIARSPCDPGTWTSSDVDMLCNISTYVPETYVKKSKIPPTEIKHSRIPATHPKLTQIMTYARQTTGVGVGVPFILDDCPSGYDTHPLTCFKPASRTCTGDWTRPLWVPGHQECSFSHAHIIGRLNNKRCPSGREENGLLCYNKCPDGYERVPGLPFVCSTPCATGDENVGTLLCKKTSCPPGYGERTAGICWQDCTATQTTVGALCRDNCTSDEYEVLGVCWTACKSTQHDIGALCRDKCTGDTPSEVLGVCWGSCGNDIDVGALCRKRCRDGFHEVAGVCWGNTGTYARQSKIPKSEKVYDPGYNPPDLPYDSSGSILDETRLGFPYCNYASPTMLNRMAQFYYDQSTLNAIVLEDDRIQYEYIVMFYGVIASSELSCDVACAMKTVKFHPITGDKYEESFGTIYPDDPGNTVSYRRFYFYKATTDAAGEFTVTGCTHKDFTAPDAQIKSTDPDVDPIISVPKIFNVIDKRTKPGTWDMENFKKAAATTAISTAAGAAGGSVGARAGPVGAIVGGVVGGVAGGMAAQAVDNAMTKIDPLEPGASIENTVIGDKDNGYFVTTNNDNFSINMGPVYEVRARDGTGYIPNFSFCTKVITTSLLCANELLLRDTVDLYHTQNPTKRIKTVFEIEPRGRDGCYYKMSTTSYNTATNIEGNVINTEEVIRKFTINDNSTCVFTPTTILTGVSGYPIRSYINERQETVYPTRIIESKARIQARYVRIRPSQTASNKILQLSQIAVYDEMGTNLAVGKGIYSNNPYSGTGADISAPVNKLVDGNLSCLVGITSNYRNAGGVDDYIEIDLGKNYYIATVVLYARIDNTNVAQNSGIRVQLLFSVGDTPVKELTTLGTDMINVVDFTTKTLNVKTPKIPFNVPRPSPPETTLGTNCPTRCQDKPEIDSFIQQFNVANNNVVNNKAQIINVLRAFTPSSTRCDYEVEMVRVVGDKKVVGKELISMTAALATTTPNSGTVYGRFIRVRPPLTSGDGYLNISQIVVKDALGNNLALNRPVVGTSRYKHEDGTLSPAPSIVTDGTLSTREWPTGIWHSATKDRDNEFLEIDLGISKPIASITYYGRTTSERNLGVRIQILSFNDMNARPTSESVLTTNNNNQTIQFNKCTFTYSPIEVSGSFIQENTPYLDSVDSSGGIFTFKNIGTTVMNIFNSIINPIKTQDPLGVLNTNVKSAETAATNTLNAVAGNQILQSGCPDRKCSDPAVLNAIIERYNNDNKLSLDYGGESNKIVQIAKAGVAGPNMCDVLFTNLYELYEDALYPPVETETTTVTKRFKLTNTGNCVMTVAPGNTSIIDISSNAIGIISPGSSLTTPYSSQCKLNCRNETILTNIKQKLNTQYQTPTVFPNFNTVVQSYQKEYSVCEYMFKKDISTKNVKTNTMSTETGVDTYVSANFTIDPSSCAATLKTVTEYEPDLITTTKDSVTGFLKSFINGAEVFLPWLYNYDNTEPSSRVDETVKILS